MSRIIYKIITNICLYIFIVLIISNFTSFKSFATEPRLWEDKIVRLGDIATIMTPTLALAKTIYEGDKDGLFYYFINFLVINLGTAGLQELIPERKPSGASMKSFPSGHASAAFSGATYVNFRYSLKESTWLYVLASFAAFTRVYGRCHHVHDVLASAVLSVLSSYLIVRNKNKDRIHSYNINYDPENRGFMFIYSCWF